MLHQQLHLPFPDTTKQSLCPIREPHSTFNVRVSTLVLPSQIQLLDPQHIIQTYIVSKMQLLTLLTTTFTLLTLTSALPAVDIEAVKDVVSSFSSFFASPPLP